MHEFSLCSKPSLRPRTGHLATHVWEGVPFLVTLAPLEPFATLSSTKKVTTFGRIARL